jgi:hypothetical protein
MIIEEIHSYFVNDERETLEVEFTVVEDGIETTTTLEILFEELEEVCELFEEFEWSGDKDYDDTETLQAKRKINPYELNEGLDIYINQNKGLVF